MADRGSASEADDRDEDMEGDYNIPGFVGKPDAAERRAAHREKTESLPITYQQFQQHMHSQQVPASHPRQRVLARGQPLLAESAVDSSSSRNNAAANLPTAPLPMIQAREGQDPVQPIRLPDSFNGIPDDRGFGPTHWRPRLHRDGLRRPPPYEPGQELRLPVWSPSLPVPVGPNARPSLTVTQENRGNADLLSSQAPSLHPRRHPRVDDGFVLGSSPAPQGAHNNSRYQSNLYPSQPSLPPVINTNSYNYRHSSYNSSYSSSSNFYPASSSPAAGARPLALHGAFSPLQRGNEDNESPRSGNGVFSLSQAPQIGASFQAYSNYSVSADPSPYQFGSDGGELGNYQAEQVQHRERQAVQTYMNTRRHNGRYGHGYHRAGDSSQSPTLAPMERSAGAGVIATETPPGSSTYSSLFASPPSPRVRPSRAAAAPGSGMAAPPLLSEGRGPHPHPTTAASSSPSRATRARADETAAPLPDPNGDIAMADEHHSGDTTEDDEEFEERSRQQQQLGQPPEDISESPLPPPQEPHDQNFRDFEEA
ncbi:uncharacterized protein PG998_002375 [Apiospora kogelbergensis]|uniref:uncharacterized protein n=1 Tax=Apiospora kogelbergensis TaxID=1337665 RepID=UPI00312F79D5